MIQNDGGTGEYEERVSPMLGLWNTVLAGNAAATWVFMGWEGIEAKRKGIELNAFKVRRAQKISTTIECLCLGEASYNGDSMYCLFQLEDYGIPYGYAPILMASPETLKGRSADIKAFLSATSQVSCLSLDVYWMSFTS